jgi:predicted RNase H-like HicB family nuclease
MNKYEIILYWSQEDEAFIAEVPELPGCMADGETYMDALKNVEVIIQEWIETATELGRKIPEPKGKLVLTHCLTENATRKCGGRMDATMMNKST